MRVDETLDELVRDVSACTTLESLACGRGMPKTPKPRVRRRGATAATHSASFSKLPVFDVGERIADVVRVCRAERKRRREGDVDERVDDATLSSLTRFTDGMALAPYAPFLHFVPRLVNIVTLAEAVPVVGSGITLPLDLSRIAARCNGAYFAPKRFAAVQLAYTNPRCRILVFRTSGPVAARLAIARAQRQLSDEAGVHLHVRNFQVINQVGAVSLRATLNCEAFAEAHRDESHFDRESFVGLAWRPAGEACCVEVYSTGRANLPGSRTERSLLASFSRMLPELLRFSSSARLLQQIPESLQAVHRSGSARTLSLPPPPPLRAAATSAGFAHDDVEEEEGEDGDGKEPHGLVADDDNDFDDAALAALGL